MGPVKLIRALGTQYMLPRVRAKALCRNTMQEYHESIHYYRERIYALKLAPQEMAILVAHANDYHGGDIARKLCPNDDWDTPLREHRDVYAVGIVLRDGMISIMVKFDVSASRALRLYTHIQPPVIIIDHGVGAVFPSDSQTT